MFITLGIILLVMCAVACKKDKMTEPPANQDQEILNYDYQTNLVVQKIKMFDSQLKAVRQGIGRSDVYLDVDSVVWNVESLFNATYSSPEKHYSDKKIQTLTFYVDTYNDMLSMNDVAALYDDIKMSVREAYSNDGFVSDKSLLSIFVDKKECRSGMSEVKVVVVSGRTSNKPTDVKPVLFGPFDVDECWYYGENGGSCDDPYLLTDAAELIEDTINYIYGYKADDEGDFRNIYVNLQTISLAGNEFKDKTGKESYLFYKQNCDDDELYLDVNELNKYYYAEVDVILNVLPNSSEYSASIPDNWVFMEVDINGVQGVVDDKDTYMHNNYIFYGTKYCVSKNEFGTHKDLLSD